MRKFKSGATRDDNNDKLDYHGFLSPIALKKYAEYMHKHRIQADGKKRAPGNWKKGVPKDSYIESAFRHFHDWWMFHDGYQGRDTLEDAVCGLLFNAFGYLHELEHERLD